MTDMRRRDGKLKIMHTIIGDFGKELRQIAEMDEIDSILTGTISPSKSYRETLTFQYFTDNGVKLLAKTTTAVQEIFLVTSAPDLVLDELVKAGHVQLEREDVRHGDPRGVRNGRKKRRRLHRNAASSGERTNQAGNPNADTAGPGGGDDRRPAGARSGRRNGENAGSPVRLDAADPLTLGQHLGADTLSALQRLKERVTPKQAVDSGAQSVRSADTAKRPLNRRDERTQGEHKQDARKLKEDEESFAELFSPAEDEESFAELLNKSKLDPKFFK